MASLRFLNSATEILPLLQVFARVLASFSEISLVKSSCLMFLRVAWASSRLLSRSSPLWRWALATISLTPLLSIVIKSCLL